MTCVVALRQAAIFLTEMRFGWPSRARPEITQLPGLKMFTKFRPRPSTCPRGKIESSVFNSLPEGSIMATAETTAAPIRIPYGPFRNEPLVDFKNSENARRMRDALAKVRAELGREYDIVIVNRLIKTEGKIKSVNPARPSEVVGIFSEAGSAHVDIAVQAAARAFESWKRASAQERADFLHNVAAILRERRFEFSAWMVYEVGKNWAEADADSAETA